MKRRVVSKKGASGYLGLYGMILNILFFSFILLYDKKNKGDVDNTPIRSPLKISQSCKLKVGIQY